MTLHCSPPLMEVAAMIKISSHIQGQYDSTHPGNSIAIVQSGQPWWGTRNHTQKWKIVFSHQENRDNIRGSDYERRRLIRPTWPPLTGINLPTSSAFRTPWPVCSRPCLMRITTQRPIRWSGSLHRIFPSRKKVRTTQIDIKQWTLSTLRSILLSLRYSLTHWTEK